MNGKNGGEETASQMLGVVVSRAEISAKSSNLESKKWWKKI